MQLCYTVAMQTLSPMETTLLALVDRAGFETVYDFSRLRLAPGTITPVLRRLQKKHFLARQSKPGARSKRLYTITPAGQAELESSWREVTGSVLAKRTPADIETIMRMALVTDLMGDYLVVDFLERAAEIRERGIDRAVLRFEQPQGKDPVSFYERICEFIRNDRLKEEAAALRRFAGALRKEK